MNIGVSTRIKTEIRSAATGKLVKRTPWIKNLVVDAGLNSLAKKNTGASNSTTMAGAFEWCFVGSGTNPNAVASGAITFTQAGMSVVASGGFFTSAMVGGILKYGTGSGGAEYYITAFTDSTHVTVDTSATHTAEVGTVWFVQQTALQTALHATNTYQTSGSSCGTTYTSTAATMQRTFVFGVQGSPYTVNEIGYGSVNGSNIVGRLVLGSSDVIDTSHFYVVVIQITYTMSPAVPTSVADVGTNIVTAGKAMQEGMNLSSVQSNGTSNAGQGLFDVSNNLYALVSSYSQNATIASDYTGGPTPTTVTLNSSANSWNYGGSVGLATVTIAFNTTTAGQTMYGFGQVTNGHVTFDILLTTPVTLPTGTFQGNATMSMVYSRVLTN